MKTYEKTPRIAPLTKSQRENHTGPTRKERRAELQGTNRILCAGWQAKTTKGPSQRDLHRIAVAERNA